MPLLTYRVRLNYRIVSYRTWARVRTRLFHAELCQLWHAPSEPSADHSASYLSRPVSESPPSAYVSTRAQLAPELGEHGSRPGPPACPARALSLSLYLSWCVPALFDTLPPAPRTVHIDTQKCTPGQCKLRNSGVTVSSLTPLSPLLMDSEMCTSRGAIIE